MTKSVSTIGSLLLCFGLAACFFGAQKETKSDAEPKLFAEGVINDLKSDDYGPTLSPDGNVIYFTRRTDRKGNESILFSRFENGRWTMPRVAEFSGKFYDKEPMFDREGKQIFFASTRPNGRDEKQNFDLWVSERTQSGWSEAKNLGANVNSPGYDNYPSVAADGTLYFASVRLDGRKDNDLYRSRLVNGEYQAAESLGNVINTPATEADPFIAPDQSYLIFSSDREGGMGEGDLYISFNVRGTWSAPKSLGKINTATYEYTPFVSTDGKTFYFSRGWGDIYYVPMSTLNLSQFKPQ